MELVYMCLKFMNCPGLSKNSLHKVDFLGSKTKEKKNHLFCKHHKKVKLCFQTVFTAEFFDNKNETLFCNNLCWFLGFFPVFGQKCIFGQKSENPEFAQIWSCDHSIFLKSYAEKICWFHTPSLPILAANDNDMT